MLTESFRVRGHAFATIESLDEWPGVKVSLLHHDTEKLVSHMGSLQAWVQRTESRSAAQAGLLVGK